MTPVQLTVIDCKTNRRMENASVVTSIETSRGLVEGSKEISNSDGEVVIPISENGIYNSVISKKSYNTFKNSFEVFITMDDCDSFHPKDVVAQSGQSGKCPMCKKIVMRLDVHMRIHSGVKQFACHLCNYRSNQSSNLNTHIRKTHYYKA